MLLKIKNQTLLGIEKLIQQAGDQNAIPDKIELTVDEAKSFMKELCVCVNYDPSLKEKVQTISNSDEYKATDMRLLIWTNNKMDKRSREEMLKDWYRNKFFFTYDGVKLVVINKQTEDRRN